MSPETTKKIEELEQQKITLQQQANFELGRIQGRIDLLKEQEEEITEEK